MLFAGLSSFTVGSVQDYLVVKDDQESIRHYKQGKYMATERALNETKTFYGKEYFLKIKEYSWGKTETTYYRKGAENFYVYNEKLAQEYIALPINPKIGEVWYSGNNGIKYEVIEMIEKFKTPSKKFKAVVKVKSEVLRSFNSHEKGTVNFQFYAKGYGQVAITTAEGEYISYLTEVVVN